GQILARSLGARRFDMTLVLAFAAAALLLAAVGVYGVVSQGVALRRGELGVRAVLGAAPDRLLALVLGGGARLAAVGIAGGLARDRREIGLRRPDFGSPRVWIDDPVQRDTAILVELTLPEPVGPSTARARDLGREHEVAHG